MHSFILIVDDRQDDIALTELALSMIDESIRTQGVYSGEQALDFLKTAAELPSIILLDLKMPGIGGIETLRRIRFDERCASIPVIIVTSSILESDVEVSKQAGATGFVHKAIRIEEYSKALAEHVKALI